MKKSNWREELNTHNAVKKYALDEIAVTATLGGIALWKLLAGGGLAATAYANRKNISQTFSNMFNRGETIDDLNKLNGFWKDTKTNNDTKIDNPIGNDLVGQTYKPETQVSDTKVGDTTGAIPGAIPATNVGAKAITKTNVGSKVRTQTRAIGKPFRLPKKLPKMPGTGHNVGRRVNPQ